MRTSSTSGSRSSRAGRAKASRLTEDPSEFVALWAAAAPAIEGVLRGRGIRHDDRAEITQEVAARAFRAHVEGTIERSFENWCKATARHLAVDNFRRDRRIDLTDQAAWEVATEHTERTVEHRLALEGLFAVWPELTRAEQMRLLAVDAPVDALARNRHYVALHRLRRRVRTLAEAAALGGLGWVGRARSRPRVLALASIALVASALSVTLLPAHAPTPPALHRGAAAGPSHDDPGSTRPARAPNHDAVDIVAASVPLPAPTRQELAVDLPDGRRAYVAKDPIAADGEPLVCVRTPPAADNACVAHPLRDLGLDPDSNASP